MTRDEFQAVYDVSPDAVFALFERMQATIAAFTARIRSSGRSSVVFMIE
jgi:hypothetical protein